MKFERFEDIIAWQKAQELALNIYEMFKSNEDFSFKDQIQRASISISSNIAEGFERKSTKSSNISALLQKEVQLKLEVYFIYLKNWIT